MHLLYGEQITVLGYLFDLMKSTRAHFKLSLRETRSNKKRIEADKLANKFLSKDPKDFWSHIKTINNDSASEAVTIDNVKGSENIAKHWHDKYKKLLNTSETNDHNVYCRKLSDKISGEPIFVSDVKSAILKSLKPGKAADLEGLMAEHFIHADESLFVFISILLNAMIIHGHLPDSFMNTIIIPIVKDKRESVTDSDNYRPVAITTVFSKIFEIIILDKYGHLFVTQANQFGFKKGHSTDMCIFVLKSIIDYYISQSSPVCICFLDASKAFDRLNHFKLFDKLIDRNLPAIIVRILAVWFSTQKFLVRWNSTYSEKFGVTNGVRQGGVFVTDTF